MPKNYKLHHNHVCGGMVLKTNYSDYQDDSYLDELAEENLKRKYNKKKKKIKDKVNIKEENIDSGGNDVEFI